MQLRVTGRNIDVGDALRAQVSQRLDLALEKYFDAGWSAQVTFARDGGGFTTDCRVHLDSGMELHTRGQAPDAYVSFDQAADRLEKRLRRYKRRLKDHHADHGEERMTATDYVIAASEEDSDDTEPVDDNPVVIAETRTAIRRMTVGMAVMALDLADAPTLMFRNVANGRLNVVYRRTDGNVGWIDPPDSGEQEA